MFMNSNFADDYETFVLHTDVDAPAADGFGAADRHPYWRRDSRHFG